MQMLLLRTQQMLPLMILLLSIKIKLEYEEFLIEKIYFTIFIAFELHVVHLLFWHLFFRCYC